MAKSRQGLSRVRVPRVPQDLEDLQSVERQRAPAAAEAWHGAVRGRGHQQPHEDQRPQRPRPCALPQASHLFQRRWNGV